MLDIVGNFLHTSDIEKGAKSMTQQVATAHRVEMEGYRAGIASQGIGRCGYALNTPEWHAWLKGYRAGYAR